MYDRLWDPLSLKGWTQISTANDVDNSNSYRPPEIALKTAVTPTNSTLPLTIRWTSENPDAEYYYYAHFAEIEDLQANETREFNVTWNGIRYYGPFVPRRGNINTIFGSSPKTCDGGKCRFQLVRTDKSTRPPLLNAFEVYTVIRFPQSETDESDVGAIVSIAETYALSRINWQGDPCVPQQFRWDGLNCSNTDMSTPPRITTLNLSSSGLAGTIAAAVQNLTQLETLDLSNNNLTGGVPEFLGNMKSLLVINLSRNNLNGSIPQALQREGLRLFVEGNPRLCLSDSCTKPHKKIIVPIVASVASAAIVIAVLVLLFVLKKRKPAILQGLHLLPMTSTMNATFAEKNSRRFIYSEVIKMTIRTYALFLEERLECYRVLKYDIEAERLPKGSGASSKNVDFNASQTYRTRMLSNEELLEQLPALQQLLFRLTGCKPEGAAYSNYLIQYALALVLKESFKIYCAINDGIINLVDLFFEMSRHDAVKALNIYKRAGQQAENLADFYEYCKGLELARNFQFPTLRQPPPSFLTTMEDYIKEAPQSGSVQKKLEYQEKEEEEEQEDEEQSAQPEEPVETENQNEHTEGDQPLIEEEEEEKEQIEEDTKPSFLIDTDDLLGLSEINPKATEIEDRNALALAIYPPGHEAPPGPSNSLSLVETGGSGWELALVTPQNNNNNIHRPAPDTKFAGGFDKLLLDSLYEDDSARRQIQLTNAGYGHGGTGTAAEAPPQNPFEMQQDPFAMSNNIAPPTNVQMAMQQQQEQQMMMMHQSPYNYSHPHDHHHQFSAAGPSPSNPFGDHFLALPPPPGSSGQHQQQNSHHHMLL